jgi:hypothetical protein
MVDQAIANPRLHHEATITFGVALPTSNLSRASDSSTTHNVAARAGPTENGNVHLAQGVTDDSARFSFSLIAALDCGTLFRNVLINETRSCAAGVVMAVYGTNTTTGVKALQRRHNKKASGWAGPDEFRWLDLPWPDAVDRAIQLTATCGFEGTGFSRAEGSRDTKTDDGITWGIVGFTSKHGELQTVLREYRASFENEKMWNEIAIKTIDGEERRQQLLRCLDANASYDCIGDWGLRIVERNKKELRPDSLEFFRTLGEDNNMQALELSWARRKNWENSGSTRDLFRKFLKRKKPSPQAVALGIDIVAFANWPFIEPCDAAEDTCLRRLGQKAVTLVEKNRPEHRKRAELRWINTILENRGSEADMRSFALQPLRLE